MDNEYNALVANGTREIVKLSPGKKTINCRWIFKVKFKSNHLLERYKVRVIARVFTGGRIGLYKDL